MNLSDLPYSQPLNRNLNSQFLISSSFPILTADFFPDL